MWPRARVWRDVFGADVGQQRLFRGDGVGGGGAAGELCGVVIGVLFGLRVVFPGVWGFGADAVGAAGAGRGVAVRPPGSRRGNPGWLDAGIQGLDSLLELGERVGILLAVGIAGFVGYELFFGGAEPAQTRSGRVLALLHDNWRAALLVGLPVFYRSLRGLIGRVRRITAGGASASFSDSGDESEPEQEAGR